MDYLQVIFSLCLLKANKERFLFKNSMNPISRITTSAVRFPRHCSIISNHNRAVYSLRQPKAEPTSKNRFNQHSRIPIISLPANELLRIIHRPRCVTFKRSYARSCCARTRLDLYFNVRIAMLARIQHVLEHGCTQRIPKPRPAARKHVSLPRLRDGRGSEGLKKKAERLEAIEGVSTCDDEWSGLTKVLSFSLVFLAMIILPERFSRSHCCTVCLNSHTVNILSTHVALTQSLVSVHLVSVLLKAPCILTSAA